MDIVAIALHTFGFEFHIKGDLPRLLVTIYEAFMAGAFIIQVGFGPSVQPHVVRPFCRNPLSNPLPNVTPVQGLVPPKATGFFRLPGPGGATGARQDA